MWLTSLSGPAKRRNSNDLDVRFQVVALESHQAGPPHRKVFKSSAKPSAPLGLPNSYLHLLSSLW